MPFRYSSNTRGHNKTKVMIFEKGRRTFYDFSIYNRNIEIVDNFKYLGITLFKNGNWYRSQKCTSQHASYALYNLFTVSNNVKFPVSQKCKLFDSLFGSILNSVQKSGVTMRAQTLN